MSVRRLVSLLSVCLVTSVGGVAVAQPKKPEAPAPVPAKDAPPAGVPVQPIDDPPPKDMQGTDENPDAPKGTDTDPLKVVAVPDKKKDAGYPIEEVLRPITLPANMSEVSIAPHAQVSPYEGADALRARYGITRQVQLGLTYVIGGIYHEPRATGSGEGPIGFHPGKAVGLDVTVLLQNWIGIKVGVPVYIDPIAVSIALGVPLKFTFGDKLAIGGLDDLLNIRVKGQFAPSFYMEGQNARGAFHANQNDTAIRSKGTLRIAAYGIYQYQPKLAIIARLGLNFEDFALNKTDAGGKGTTFVRGGFNYSVKRYLDLGLSVGWENLADLKTFAPAGYLAVRI